jgi:inorganic pyrophosphatase
MKKRNGVNWLGKNVRVVIDRKVGSRHPDFPATIYQLNYGYVPDTIGGGEPIDAYIMGEDRPVDEYQGKVIAVVEREDDNEFKLVVAEHKYDKEEIVKEIAFQEKYFISKITL